jgi:hypothetical protein
VCPLRNVGHFRRHNQCRNSTLQNAERRTRRAGGEHSLGFFRMRRGLLPDQARPDDPRQPASSAPTASITPIWHRSTEKSLSIGRGKASFHRPSYGPSPPPRPDSRACQTGSVTAPGGGTRGTVAEAGPVSTAWRLTERGPAGCGGGGSSPRTDEAPLYIRPLPWFLGNVWSGDRPSRHRGDGYNHRDDGRAVQPCRRVRGRHYAPMAMWGDWQRGSAGCLQQRRPQDGQGALPAYPTPGLYRPDRPGRGPLSGVEFLH